MLNTVQLGARRLFEVLLALIFLMFFLLGCFFLLPCGCDTKKTGPLPFSRLRRKQDGTHQGVGEGRLALDFCPV